MSFRFPASFGALLVGLILGPLAHADTFYSTSGTFAADNSVFVYSFATAATQNYTFTTTSYANGGFLPDLTLFQSNGNFVDFSSLAGAGDVSFSDTLGPGSYLLYLTEFPNEFVGPPNLIDGSFAFADDPTATGDVCNTPGGMFLASNSAPCTQRTATFALSVTGTAVPSSVTPEPSTFLLTVPSLVLLAGCVRRRLA